MKRKVVIVGLYLPGIYPRGEDDVVAELLAPAYMKAVVDTDPALSQAYEVKVLNLPTTISKEELVEKICREDPYMAAFSVYIWNFELMHQSTTLLKQKKPRLHIIWGGPEVSYNAPEMMAVNPHVTSIICGSGEQKFLRMLRTSLSPSELSQIPSIAYREANGEIRQVPGNIEDDLSKIPSPFQTGTINLDDNQRHSVYLETYRGCIFQCGYCMWMGDKKKEIVLFPMEQVLKDIDIVYNHPNVASVVFTDACIFYRKERAKKICDRIASCSRTIETTLTLDIAFMNEEAIDSLHKISFAQHGFHFGMQSINQETLRSMNRKIGPGLFSSRIKMIKEIDPNTEISFDLIYGLPGDDHESFRSTVNFALHLSPVKLNMSPLVLLPGSLFWANRKEHGFIYDPYPPYLIHSNNTYSSSDMKKSRRLVLGIMLVLYFSTIREAIYKISEQNPNLKRIDLFEEFILRLEQRTNLLLDITNIRDQEQYSPQELNYIRRNIMNTVAEPQNGLYAYEVVYEILKEYHLEEGAGADVRLGMEFYKKQVQGGHDEHQVEALFRSRYGDKKVDGIKFNWVTAKPVGITQESKTKGVAAIC